MTPSRSHSEDDAPHIPGYQIAGVLGKGGMGRVYLAQQTKLGRRVAIKAFFLEGPKEQVDPFYQRFLSEAQVLAQMEAHENIVQVFDLVEDDEGTNYIVMEYVEGQTLSDALTKGLPLEDAARIVADACKALGHAHGRGIIHRDIKPGNIMLTRRGQVKIMDFGIARANNLVNRTRTGTIMGTPQYMSPEQLVDSKHTDARSDVYSLAVVLYQLITGKIPFKDANFYGLVNKIQFQDPEPPSKLRPELHPRFEAAILRGLAKRPDARFQTAAEFEATLRQLIVDGAIFAPGYSASELPATTQPDLDHLARQATELDPEDNAEKIPQLFSKADPGSSAHQPTEAYAGPESRGSAPSLREAYASGEAATAPQFSDEAPTRGNPKTTAPLPAGAQFAETIAGDPTPFSRETPGIETPKTMPRLPTEEQIASFFDEAWGSSASAASQRGNPKVTAPLPAEAQMAARLASEASRPAAEPPSRGSAVAPLRPATQIAPGLAEEASRPLLEPPSRSGPKVTAPLSAAAQMAAQLAAAQSEPKSSGGAPASEARVPSRGDSAVSSPLEPRVLSGGGIASRPGKATTQFDPQEALRLEAEARASASTPGPAFQRNETSEFSYENNFNLAPDNKSNPNIKSKFAESKIETPPSRQPEAPSPARMREAPSQHAFELASNPYVESKSTNNLAAGSMPNDAPKTASKINNNTIPSQITNEQNKNSGSIKFVIIIILAAFTLTVLVYVVGTMIFENLFGSQKNVVPLPLQNAPSSVFPGSSPTPLMTNQRRSTKETPSATESRNNLSKEQMKEEFESVFQEYTHYFKNFTEEKKKLSIDDLNIYEKEFLKYKTLFSNTKQHSIKINNEHVQIFEINNTISFNIVADIKFSFDDWEDFQINKDSEIKFTKDLDVWRVPGAYTKDFLFKINKDIENSFITKFNLSIVQINQYIKDDNFDKAQALIQKTEIAYKKAIAIYQWDEWHKEAQAINKNISSLKLWTENRAYAQQLLEEAEQHDRTGNYEKALELLFQARERDPDFALLNKKHKDVTNALLVQAHQMLDTEHNKNEKRRIYNLIIKYNFREDPLYKQAESRLRELN
jgi:serine/threonine protein kinase